VSQLPLLLHAGPGSTWQAAVVVASVALAVCVILAAAGRLRIADPGDLLLPLAGSAVLGSLGVLGHVIISDAIGFALPIGLVALLALLLAAFTPLELTPVSPLALGALALATVGTVLLWQPLTIALHPPPDMLPLRDDSEVTIVAPEHGATVPAGGLEVTVTVTGGSIGPVISDLADLPLDPEEAGTLSVFVDGDRIPVDWEGCPVSDPCDEVTVTVPVEAGERQVAVEFVRGDGTPFAPTVIDRVTIIAE